MLKSSLLRNSLKIGIAAFLTAAIAIWCERITFVWYSLMAVVFVVDDNDAQTMQAASARLLGTIAGGLITFVVHTILTGWIGVMVSFLLILPVLRVAGWQSASGVATLVSVMFLMIPTHVELNWDYVFNRSLDTLLGSVVALGVGLLLWPRNQHDQLEAIPLALRAELAAQVAAYQHWWGGTGARPQPLAPAQFTASLVQLEELLQQELQGPQGRTLRLEHWPQRQLLWHHLHQHWIQWERMVLLLPDQRSFMAAGDAGSDPFAASLASLACLLATGPGTSGLLAGSERLAQGAGAWSDPYGAASWRSLAVQLAQPQLLLLAIAEEWRPLQASLRSLNLIAASNAVRSRGMQPCRPRRPSGPAQAHRSQVHVPKPPLAPGAVGPC